MRCGSTGFAWNGGRTFGDVWLGWTLWRALRLDEVVARLLPEGQEAVPWATMEAVLVLARLSEPANELDIAETWYRATALEDLIPLSPNLEFRYFVLQLAESHLTRDGLPRECSRPKGDPRGRRPGVACALPV